MKMFIVMALQNGTYKPLMHTLAPSEQMAKLRACAGTFTAYYWDSNCVIIPVEIKSTCGTCGGLGYCGNPEVKDKQWACLTCKGATL